MEGKGERTSQSSRVSFRFARRSFRLEYVDLVETHLSKRHSELGGVLGGEESLDVVVVGLAGESALELDESREGEGSSFESSVDLIDGTKQDTEDEISVASCRVYNEATERKRAREGGEDEPCRSWL